MIVVTDIDGVLCDPRAYVKMFLLQGKKDWDTYFQNTLNFPMISHMCELMRGLAKDNQLFFVTARPESNRDATREWLSLTMKKDIDNLRILMRKDGDRRQSALDKDDLVNKVIPDIIFEDESQSVLALRKEGYFVIQIHGYRLPEETPTDLIPE